MSDRGDLLAKCMPLSNNSKMQILHRSAKAKPDWAVAVVCLYAGVVEVSS